MVDKRPAAATSSCIVSASQKILVAMSGGVDSSVAALLLKQQGHELVGAYMKNWINEDNVIGHCPWMQDIEDARAVCDRLGIEFRVVNLMQDYRERVVAYLLDGYKRGLTPNPDIMCNREIKFGVFRQWARDHGFGAVATGHYARRIELPQEQASSPEQSNLLGYSDGSITRQTPIQSNPIGYSGSGGKGRFALLEGVDKNKDQSYFLTLLSQEQLADARFPIGHLPKPELRRLAAEAGLLTAAKKDSQGICFIGEVKMQDFLRQYVPDQPGPIIRATDGKPLGQHPGLHYYTLGQRKGIGVPSNTDNQAYVVVGKRAEDNALLVAFDAADAPGLFQTEVRVHSLQWNATPVTAPRRLEGRVRYRDARTPIEFIPEGDGATARVRFDTPQRGLASGQILAFYEGERLLGGAVYL